MRCMDLGRGGAPSPSREQSSRRGARSTASPGIKLSQRSIITDFQVHKIIRERFVALLAVLSAQCRLQNKRCNTAHEP